MTGVTEAVSVYPVAAVFGSVAVSFPAAGSVALFTW
jgi:hypothetical protein